MITTRRERNENFIAWPVLETDETFTPCAPVEWKYVVPERGGLFECGRTREFEADSDIAAGRVKRFNSIDDMLSSLKH